MKLYTEEQLRACYNDGVENGYYGDGHEYEDLFINSLTPIELPSDEEILKAAKECVYEDLDISVGSFELGARWYREQLKNK